MSLTGKDLVSWGIPSGPHFPAALAAARAVLDAGGSRAEAEAAAREKVPPPKLRAKAAPAPFTVNLAPEDAEDWANLAAVERDMRRLMTLPTVTRGAVMPDACPAGVIPVGGVVETDGAIHPGFHSADICCSVMATFLPPRTDPARLLDAAHATTHFGGGGRAPGTRVPMPAALEDAFAGNPLTRPLLVDAAAHFATQGDGNHFLFVGRRRSDGAVALVTHHGSRRPGAHLYREGMRLAKAATRSLADGIPDALAWIPLDSPEGRAYWDALQILREWTKANHLAVHDRAIAAAGVAGRPVDFVWNEHNFVFRRGGRVLHGKGATPAWGEHAADADPRGRVLVPLNMAAPILVAVGSDAAGGLGFAPHGAGRVRSRSAHARDFGEAWGAQELASLREAGLDIRFFHGTPDATELPSAYKGAAAIERQTRDFGLATIDDHIDPFGSIMAGSWSREPLDPAADAPDG